MLSILTVVGKEVMEQRRAVVTLGIKAVLTFCSAIVLMVVGKEVMFFSTNTVLRSSTHMMDVEETEFGSRLINVDVMSSTELQRKKIKQAQLKILEANQKVRDLSINIR